MAGPDKKGYTIVELLVSAVIVALLTIIVVSLVRKSNEITSEDAHRRRARTVIDSCFESRAYHFSNYVNLKGDTAAVIIDKRAGNELYGTVTISVSEERLISGLNSVSVPYKEVAIQVQWPEPQSVQSIHLTKWITQL